MRGGGGAGGGGGRGLYSEGTLRFKIGWAYNLI